MVQIDCYIRTNTAFLRERLRYSGIQADCADDFTGPWLAAGGGFYRSVTPGSLDRYPTAVDCGDDRALFLSLATRKKYRL